MNPREILERADTCVKCGFCLPHCPTYRKMANEAESPRGRVALIQGLVSGALADTPTLRGHLGRCLECRACESACPSGVPVTRLVDAVRAQATGRLSLPRRLLRLGLLKLAARPDPAMTGLRLYERSGLQRLIRGSRLLAPFAQLQRAERLLPPLPAAPPATAVQAGRGDLGPVNLFPGCVSRHLDRMAHDAAAEVLTRLGFEVMRPTPPCCCGALYRHDGFAREADRELAKCSALFTGPPLLTLASACQAELQGDAMLASQVHEITRFLADLTWPARLALRPSTARVWVHTPCTQRNALEDPDVAFELLRRIPGLSLEPLPENGVCCGAAGAYVLKQPALSDALLADKIAHLRRDPPDCLVTTNTGCALHLAAGIRAAGLGVEVCHPVQLIARQLPRQSGKSEG